METLIGSQIYIKKRPDLFKVKFEDVERFNMQRDENDDQEMLDEILEDMYRREEERELDYSGCTTFWLSKVAEDGVDIFEQPPVGKGREEYYETMEDLERDFMSLTSYLEKAKYIGRKFKAKPDNPCAAIINCGHDRNILYATDRIWLVEDTNERLGHLFELILVDPDKGEFAEDEAYEINNDINPDYKDKGKMYNEILRYISNIKRKRL